MSISLKNDAGTFSTNLNQSNPTKNVNIALPTTSGTMALTSQLGRRNYLINGNFDIWQRGISQTSSGYGSDDRWNNYHSGSTKSHLQQPAGDLARALFNASKISETVVTSVAGASNYVIKAQTIEDVTKLAGKTVTLSFWAKADSNKNIAIEFLQSFGVGGSPSSSVYGIGMQLVALTTTWQKKTITVTLPSILGKTLGTDGVHTTFTQLSFWFDAGSNWSSRTSSLGQQSGTFYIAEVKLEDGSVATDGWHPYDGEFGGEIQACQRYYWKSDVYGFSFRTMSYSTSSITITIPYKVQMRTFPTITYAVEDNDTPTTIDLTEIRRDVASLLKSTTISGHFYDLSAFTASAEL